MNKKIVLLVCMLLLSVGLLSGCFSSIFTEDPKLLKIANSISPPFNVTSNMTFRYSYVLRIEKNDWYTADVYVEYDDAPWLDNWWGVLWFNEKGDYHFIERS